MVRFTSAVTGYFVAAAQRAAASHSPRSSAISLATSDLGSNFGLASQGRHPRKGCGAARGLQPAAAGRPAHCRSGELSTKVVHLVSLGCLATVYPLVMRELAGALKERHRNAGIVAVTDDQAGLIDQLRVGRRSLKRGHNHVGP
jgi:hypothetical protein